LTIEDFISLRPAVGISPAEVDTYIGKELRIQVREFERIRPDHFK
jgi:sialic acid synthase SpsE